MATITLMIRFALAILLVSAAACSAPPPEEAPCLHCAEAGDGSPAVAVREQERLLCPDSFRSSWEPLHQCRCAASAPCDGSCATWCAGGAVEQSCTDCTATACAAELAGCQGDGP